MSRLTLGIALLVLLASCSPAPSSDPLRDMATEIASLSEAAISYHAAATAKDAATVGRELCCGCLDGAPERAARGRDC